MYTCGLESLDPVAYTLTALGRCEESVAFDLDDDRPSGDPLVLGLTLDLGQHLEQQLDLITDTQYMWSAQSEAL